ISTRPSRPYSSASVKMERRKRLGRPSRPTASICLRSWALCRAWRSISGVGSFWGVGSICGTPSARFARHRCRRFGGLLRCFRRPGGNGRRLRQRFKAFQTVVNVTAGVMLALVADVLNDPRQMGRTETDDTVARLPLQYFIRVSELPICLVRRRAFELAHQVTDED